MKNLPRISRLHMLKDKTSKYYTAGASINNSLGYYLRMLRKNLTETHLMAKRKYNAARELMNRYELHDKDILEIGAGDRGGLSILMTGKNRVVAIDLPERFTRLGLRLKTAIRRSIFDPIYFSHLKRLQSSTLVKPTVILGDACHTSFCDASFDFIFSQSVLEHIPRDVIADLVRENKRLLKKGGIADHVIAVWTHLDGGHTFGYDVSRPWAHLREQDFISQIYLNKMRIYEYEDVFAEYFGKENVIVETSQSPEAQQLLTDEVWHELSKVGYSKEELTINSVRLIARI